ncbi:zinc ABC transporter substrate-binding protein [bacterium]|nr:zinc ABC transporter substrate-binding protein [bacterium]
MALPEKPRHAPKKKSSAKVRGARFPFAAILALAAIAGAWAGTGGPGVAPASAPTVVVSILPQSEFVARIAGDKVKIITLVGPGASPHSYEPTPRQMAGLSGASLWLTVGGIEFEKAFLPKVKALYPHLRIVDTAAGVKFRTLESHSHEGEAAAPAAAPAAGAKAAPAPAAPAVDAEGGIDPHVWLGRDAVKIQLSAATEALCALLPAEASQFRKNRDAYVAEIDSAFASIAKELAPLKGKKVFVYHPSFGYFLDSFGILQEAVELGGKEPTQKSLAALIAEAKADGAKVVFVQKQFSTNAARTVAAAIGGVVVEVDPLAPDWLANIKAMGAALMRAIR